MTAEKIPDKSQENYPGPRKPEKAPDFVKDWEAEPPRPTKKSENDSVEKD